MSAERMMVNAMQEQPILLLPVFLMICFMKNAIKQLATALLANNTFTTRLMQ